MRKEKLEELNNLIESLKVIKYEKLNIESKFLSTEVYNCTLKSGEIIRREKILKNMVLSNFNQWMSRGFEKEK